MDNGKNLNIKQNNEVLPDSQTAKEFAFFQLNKGEWQTLQLVGTEVQHSEPRNSTKLIRYVGQFVTPQ